MPFLPLSQQRQSTEGISELLNNNNNKQIFNVEKLGNYMYAARM